MAHTPLANAYDMKGAFNSIAIKIQKDASEQDVIDQVDNLIDRYGGQGAYGRDDQLSNMFLKDEFSQLETMAYLFPAIFLGVAVFLLNVVVTRLVETQREIIAILKAFGYSNTHIALHFAQLVLMITGLGIIGGYLLGMYLGQLITVTYTQYFRFPLLLYTPGVSMFIVVGLLTCMASLVGTLRAVYKAAALPPAEAMRPEPPAIYQKTLLESLLQNLLSQPSRMILRHLRKQPLKTGLSVLGLAMAGAIMMVGNFQQDAVELMMHAQFKLAQKQDIEVNFYEPVSPKTLASIRNIDGVQYAEGVRSVPVKLSYEQRSYRTSIQGLPEKAIYTRC